MDYICQSEAFIACLILISIPFLWYEILVFVVCCTGYDKSDGEEQQ